MCHRCFCPGTATRSRAWRGQPQPPPRGAEHQQGGDHHGEAGELDGLGQDPPPGERAGRRHQAGHRQDQRRDRVPVPEPGRPAAGAGRGPPSRLPPAVALSALSLTVLASYRAVTDLGGAWSPSFRAGRRIRRRGRSIAIFLSKNRTFGPVLYSSCLMECFAMATGRAAPGSGAIRGAEGSVCRAGEAHGALTPVRVVSRHLPVRASRPAASARLLLPGRRGCG